MAKRTQKELAEYVNLSLEMTAKKLKPAKTFLTKEAAEQIASDLERDDEDGWKYMAEILDRDTDPDTWVIEVFDEDCGYVGML